jgi:hypothetical protein
VVVILWRRPRLASPNALKDLPKLQSLTLMRTQVTGKGLAKVQALRHLKVLVLMRLKTTPALIEQLKHFQHLDELQIGQTHFSDEERRELTAALPKLSISQN